MYLCPDTSTSVIVISFIRQNICVAEVVLRLKRIGFLRRSEAGCCAEQLRVLSRRYDVRISAGNGEGPGEAVDK